MCNDVGETSRCCLGYSIVGALFTGWVGIMITVQPFYIAGLEDPEEAKISAFGAMGVFLVTLVLSLLGIVCSSVVGSSKSDGAEAAAAFSSEMEAEGYVLNTGDAVDYGTKY